MFIRANERALRDIMQYLPIQAGNVEATYTDILENHKKMNGLRKVLFYNKGLISGRAIFVLL